MCHGQIDMYDGPSAAPFKFNYGCANDFRHYRIMFDSFASSGAIRYENILLYEGKHLFDVDQYISGMTVVRMADIDPEGRIVANKEGLLYHSSLRFEKKLFDFQQTNREKILNRIKTVLVFT